MRSGRPPSKKVSTLFESGGLHQYSRHECQVVCMPKIAKISLNFALLSFTARKFRYFYSPSVSWENMKNDTLKTLLSFI